MKLISAQNLDKYYENKEGKDYVLKNINLTIHKGDYLSIMGPTGSGKTTLIEILGGFIEKSHGDSELLNKNIELYSKKELIDLRASKIAFVFQSYQLINELTVFENVLLANSIKEIPNQNKILALLDILKIRQYKDFYPNMLSGGTKQRTAIARALINEPEILFLDEPTASLDEHTKKELLYFLKEQNELKHLTIITITHDKDVALNAKRMIELKDGSVIKDEKINL